MCVPTLSIVHLITIQNYSGLDSRGWIATFRKSVDIDFGDKVYITPYKEQDL